MGNGIGVLMALLIGGVLIGAAVIEIVCLTVKKLKELIKKRKEKNENSKVAFGETRKIVEENTKEILEKAPSITMEDLETMCEETPYFVTDYNSDTDEVSDFTRIETESVDEKIESIMDQNDGIILFD